ncbi:MAG: class I SAM-dependent methyltransferase [Lentisphaerae bacterium]|nr:class I SAM-dependent methyltransferase [Lentisphaerota bacterium]
MSASFWDEMYGDISKSRPWENPEWVEVCKKQIEECLRPISLRKHSLSLLDFGCGAGLYFPLFQELGFNQITGVDISKVVIDYLREKHGENPSIHLMAGDIRALQSHAIKYDVIMFWGVAHHLDPKEWDVCLQRFDELLSADGVLLVSGWGGDDPRFIKGSPAFSVHSHKQTWSIDAIKFLLESRFIIEEFGNLHYQNKDPLLCSDAFNFYMCKKKLAIEQRLLSNLRSYLSTLYDRISFTQFIRYSFESDVKNAQMDREKSVTYYRDKLELIEIFGSLIRQVIEKCGRNTSFTTEIYQRPQKYNIFVEMDANPKKLLCVGNSNSIRYYFRGDEQDESSHYRYWGTSFTGNDIQETSVKELFSQIEGECGSNYQGCDFSDLKKVGTYSRVDTFAEKLFYAFNQGRKLFFYYFNNATLKVSHKELGDGGLMIYATSALSNEELATIDTLFKGWASALSIDSFAKLSAKLATKSAIGAIMSRNGSHNIGSHVLAALSHNVGTMPDDRIFYQYIQHRMDYIATAVGDFPLWRQPTMFVCDIMRAFLSQAHLLNYISRSEGLCAYQFQNPAYIYQSLPNTSDRNVQHKTIRLHVRRIKDDCKEGWETNFASLVGTDNVEDFITDYPTDGTWNTMPSNGNASPDESASFDRDVAVAIPGGVVGQHAIFTILENIIRNAAKHEWSKLDDAAKVNNDLDVYVDFRDNPRDKRIEVRVWNDRVGDVPSGMSDTVEALKEKVKGSLISPDSGALVRENWGLAEMRISVGYLQNADIDKIGGIGNEHGKSIELIEPIVVQNGKKECLGYKFWLHKPQELLIQVPDRVAKSDLSVVNSALSRFGIELMRTEDVLKSKGLAYSYALMGNLDFSQEESNWPKLPFRVLSPVDVAGQRGKMNRIARYDGDFYPLKDGVIDEKALCDKVKVLSANLRDDTVASKFAWDLLEDIHACWIDYIRKVRKVTNESILSVDVDGGEEAKGKSLITDADLLHFVFEHSFNSAVRGYLRTIEKKRTRPELAGALYLLVMLKERPIMPVGMLSEHTDNSKRIALQLIRFAEAAKATMPEEINVSATDQDGISYVDVRWQETVRGLKTRNCLYYLYGGCERVFYNSDGDGYSDVRNFVKYICEVVLEQAKSFLAKYEERIVTLPRSFGVTKRTPRSDKTPIVWKRRGENDGEKVLSVLFSSNRSAAEEFLENGEGGLCYWRHGDDEFTQKPGDEESKIDKALYFEPLSGSQSYLNSISALQQKIDCLATKQSDDRLSVVREMTGMVENALLRVLVIDERATKFLKDHRDVAEILKRAGVRACDENNTGVADFRNSRFELAIDAETILATDFDIVIIHQGIIDKILKEDNSQSDVGDFLKTLQQHIRYVVITTGRGTPSNIPPTARVLPFSIIEKTLFKRYPEKLLLVDTVMNILPNERSL